MALALLSSVIDDEIDVIDHESQADISITIDYSNEMKASSRTALLFTPVARNLFIIQSTWELQLEHIYDIYYNNTKLLLIGEGS